MPVPDFQSIMLPLLRLARDGEEHSLRDAVQNLASHFSLSDDELSAMLQSGQPVFYNRVVWARAYLKAAKLLELPRRGHFRITARGRQVLGENPKEINMKFLEQFPEYVEFRMRRRKPPEKPDELTPEEALEDAYQKIREDLTEQLLTQVLDCSPAQFERLVVDLLVKMGYGGSRREAGRAIGKSGDEGVDGVIDEDRLGLDTVCVQAKRWKQDSPVTRPEIQKFAGALQGRRARKGVFITTSRFTDDAREFVSKIESKIVLIDGERLAGLMIDYGVGVSPVARYEIKAVDSDYFGEALQRG